MSESLKNQVERLAQFIMREVPGEPSRSEEGAVDTVIRLLRRTPPASEPGGAIDAAIERARGEGWISVEERLPPKAHKSGWGKTVLVARPAPEGTTFGGGVCCLVRSDRMTPEGEWETLAGITHWRPLPDPPPQEEEQ